MLAVAVRMFLESLPNLYNATRTSGLLESILRILVAMRI